MGAIATTQAQETSPAYVQQCNHGNATLIHCITIEKQKLLQCPPQHQANRLVYDGNQKHWALCVAPAKPIKTNKLHDYQSPAPAPSPHTSHFSPGEQNLLYTYRSAATRLFTCFWRATTTAIW